MKKTLLTSIILAGSLALTGCSSVSFDNVVLEKAPEWDLSKTTNGAWGNEDFTSTDRDTANPSYLKLFNKDKSCYIDGRIAYTTPTVKDAKDKENSLEYLNSLGLQNINGKDFVASETTINDVRYVVGEYKLPPSFGEYSYHKTAVRVFSNIVPITEVSEDATGMPLIIVDMACKNDKNINEETWNKASSFFTLILSEEAVIVDNEYGEPILPPTNENADLPPQETPPVNPEEQGNVPPLEN